jgi:putative hemin transport protein
MNDVALKSRNNRDSILSSYRTLKREKPKARAKDVAALMGVSEAELLAARTSDEIVRLDGDFADIIRATPALGKVMALTRNEHCVHEKHGVYDKINIGPGHGIVLNHDIDLRLFMSHWRWAFAVTEEVASGRRSSLQFFDIDGRAVHKIYVPKDSDLTAYHRIVEQFRAQDQTYIPQTVSLPNGPKESADADVDADGFLTHWDALQDTHDFFGLLREFGIARRQSMRLAKDRFTRQLQSRSVETLLEAAASSGTSIMCFVGNPGCIQIHTGPVETIKIMGPWLNVLDSGFNLHLDTRSIESVWAVEKPTRDGIVTSVEIYGPDGKCFCQFFGERKPGQDELTAWRDIVAALPSQD